MQTLKYCPTLNSLTGSITASLLMCQLEYWFNRTNGEAFYKFLEPCEDEHYHMGDSWTEEMGFTKSEFRTAFKHIGKVYKSKSEFLKSKDPFEGKLYLSYYDRIKKLTYYIRNHTVTSKLLGNLHCELPYSLDYSSSEITTLKSSRQTDLAPTPYDQILELFHTNCPSLPKVHHLSAYCKHQLDKLCHKLKDQGEDVLTTLERAFKMVEDSDFLCGKKGAGKWKALFGWIIRTDKFFAILEGAYAPFKDTNHAPSSASADLPDSTSHPSPTHIASSFSPYIPRCTSNLASPSTSPRRPHSTFMRMYTHDFDLKALEAQEMAYLEACYG